MTPNYYNVYVYRFLLTKSCRRKLVLDYFGEAVSDATSCISMGDALCDNCALSQVKTCEVSKADHFKIIADAITDLPEHGVHKVLHINSAIALICLYKYNTHSTSDSCKLITLCFLDQ